MVSHRAAALLVLGLSVAAGGCAPGRLTLPTSGGRPLAEFQPILAEATAACSATQTLTAELQLSGRVSGRRVSGRALAGLAQPDALRLEGLAPFGPPAFILVADDGRALLLLPRENRLLRDEPPAVVLEALAGIALDPADVLALLAGCVFPPSRPLTARTYGDWVSVDLEDGGRLYAKQQGGRWVLLAGTRDGWQVEYRRRAVGYPDEIRLWSAARDARVTVGVSDVEVNVPLGSEAFGLEVPGNAEPLSLDELRSRGPLGHDPADGPS